MSIAVFGRGTDNRLWWRHETRTGWTAWAPLGGVLTSRPAVTVGGALAPDSLSVGAWHSIGGKTAAGPGITSPAPKAVAAFVRGTDNAAWSNLFFGRMKGVAGGWHSMHGKLTSGVTAVTRPETYQTTVYGLGTDKLPWANGWPAGPGWGRVVIDY